MNISESGFAVLWILFVSGYNVDLPASAFAVFWTLSISWSRQHSCANSLNIVYTHFVLLNTERITGQGYFVSSDIEWITGYRYLCVSGHRTDHRTDIQWTNC